ncbi:MAG: single-stranded-DNA-specific exonuclease RecJ, partial [Anaerolineaceae bacterium]|nr:single-stranded-DNA-specific exonuclease RecJ [Anaerolineaceae bacterium]
MTTLPARKNWAIAPKIPTEAANNLAAFSPILQQLLYNRGVSNEQEAQDYLYGLEIYKQPDHSPFLLKGMEAAVDRILQAIRLAEPIAIYGDYDVDGVTATALMVQVLRGLSANVIPYIPNRFDEGYGLNNEAIDTLAGQGIRLIVTVDCGIRSVSEADYAREKGIDLVISDHHHPREVIPTAAAVICQKQDGDDYPNKNLSGVGIAFKIAQA